MISANLIRKISEVEPHLRDILISILEEIEKHTQQIAQQVTKEEFNELKEIVADLAKKVGELAEAQKKTEQRINELAEAQKRSEERITRLEKTVAELAEAQKKTEEELRKLAQSLERTNRQIGGLSRSVAYALENEAYRKLPGILKNRYNIEVTEKFIRTYIGGEEINIFAKAKKNGKEVHLVGEAVLKLDDREKLRWVMEKVNLVKEELGGEVIPIIVTHFARPDILERASRAGVIVIQSFEW